MQILIAEDNALTQMLLRRALENHGHAVTVVNDGDEAVEACQNHRFDVLLMDMQMPRLSGDHAIARIRSSGLNREVAIVAVTADTSREMHAHCLRAGANACMTKPVAVDGLLALLVELTQCVASPGSGEAVAPPMGFGHLDSGMWSELAVTFFDTVPELVSKVNMAVRQRREAESLRELHSLSGAAALFDTVNIHGITTRMEAAVTELNWLLAERLMPELEAGIENLSQHLRQWSALQS